MISAVIITKNEEKNIEKCINSVLWCNEVIIINDATEKILNSKLQILRDQKKVKIFQRELNGDFSSQRNFGLEKASGEWVLFVDADEVVTKKLAKEIKQEISEEKDEIKGYYIKRQDFFEGRWLNHGETANVELLRLAKKGVGKWQGRVHEEWLVDSTKAFLTSPLLHYPHQTLSEFLKKINYYSTIRAKELYETGVSVKFWQILFYPKIKFLQNYFIRLGVLDGFPGLIMAMVMSFHSFLVRGKLYLLKRKK